MFAEALAEPPAPLHVKLNVLFGAVSAPLLLEPAVARLPDHAPLAVHDVAFEDDQVSVLLPPLDTFAGLELIVTIGVGEVVVTVTDRLADPPLPVHASVKVLVAAVSEPLLAEPDVARPPDQAPLAVHDAALVDDQFSVLLPPLATDVGLALSVTVGVGGGAEVTVTVVEPLPEPPAPLQVSVNKLLDAVRGPVLADPVVARVPDQLPPALQDVAFEEVQFSVALPPLPTLDGVEVNETVGAVA